MSNTKITRVGEACFYHVYNFLSPDLVNSLLKCVETNHGDHEDGWEIRNIKQDVREAISQEDWIRWGKTLGHTEDLPYDFLKKQDFWNSYFTKMHYYLAEYLKIANLDYPNIKALTTWFVRAYGYTQVDIDRFHKPYGNSGELYVDKQHHTHPANHVVGCVYYLKTPSEAYGTLIRINDQEFILPGKENSILFFDPRIPHSSVRPSPEIGQKYPRHTVITDFGIDKPFSQVDTLISKIREQGATKRWNKLINIS